LEGSYKIRQKNLIQNVLKKWQHAFSPNFQLKWKDVWIKKRANFFFNFIRSTLHQAIVVNTWKTKTNPNIKIDCPSCSFAMVKFIVPRFWLRFRAKKAQEIAPFFLISIHKLIIAHP
jgi:hypothetical protein